LRCGPGKRGGDGKANAKGNAESGKLFHVEPPSNTHACDVGSALI
jgi:hypothetical protein